MNYPAQQLTALFLGEESKYDTPELRSLIERSLPIPAHGIDVCDADGNVYRLDPGELGELEFCFCVKNSVTAFVLDCMYVCKGDRSSELLKRGFKEEEFNVPFSNGDRPYGGLTSRLWKLIN